MLVEGLHHRDLRPVEGALLLRVLRLGEEDPLQALQEEDLLQHPRLEEVLLQDRQERHRPHPDLQALMLVEDLPHLVPQEDDPLHRILMGKRLE